MRVDPAKTAILVVHCQGDIVGANGALSGMFRTEFEARDVLNSIRNLTEIARAAGVLIIYTRVAFAPDYSNLEPNNALLATSKELGCLVDGSPLADVVDELAPRPEDEIHTHQRVGAFAGTELDQRLRARGIENLALTGVATNLSVESTARFATDLGYRTIMVRDAMSAATPAAHDAALETLALLTEVVTAQELLAALA